MRKALLTTLVIVLTLLAGCGAQSPPAGDSRTGQNRIAQTAAATAGEPAQIAAPSSDLAPQPAPKETASPAPDKAGEASHSAETSAPDQDTPAPASMDVYRTGGAVAAAVLYPAPDASAAGLGQIEAGSEVVVTRALGDWYEIIYLDAPGSHAWVRQDSVSFAAETPPSTPTAAPAAAATPAPTTRAVTAAAKAASGTGAAQRTEATKSSGLSGVLVFQEHNGGMIYLYDLKSRTLRPLTGGLDPALSPDGSTVAFIRFGGEQGLYLINADGTNERRIYGGSRDLRAPGWSPDGQYIVFSRVNGEDKCRQVGPRCVPDRPGLEGFPLVIMDKRGLSRVNPDGGDFQDIPSMGIASTPDWNASGIVYAVGEGLQVTAEQPDAASRSLLDARNYSAQDPSWQPGGGRIVFQKKEGTHWEIFSINPDGSGLEALTRPVSVLVDELPQNVSPAWSPDGRSIVYLSNREADGSAGKWRIWVMDADGGNQHPLDPDILGQVEFRYDNSADQMIDWS